MIFLDTFQLKGSGAELSRRVQNLLTITHGQANGSGAGNSIYLQGSAKIHEQSLADMQEVRIYLCLESAFSLVVLLEINIMRLTKIPLSVFLKEDMV